MNTEEKRNQVKAYKLLTLTLVLGIIFFFYGIPALGRFAAFVSDLAKSDKKIDSSDITPPAPPQLDTPPEFTNEQSIKLLGKSEAGANIKINFNRDGFETIADSDGNFEKSISLMKGENTVFATAVDYSGNQSQPTKTYTVVFDSEAPDITLASPSDGASFFGTRQRQVDIKGAIDDNEADIYINERFISLDQQGVFQYTTTLSEGENKFNIKAVDKAGNQTELSLTLNFSL